MKAGPKAIISTAFKSFGYTAVETKDPKMPYFMTAHKGNSKKRYVIFGCSKSEIKNKIERLKKMHGDKELSVTAFYYGSAYLTVLGCKVNPLKELKELSGKYIKMKFSQGTKYDPMDSLSDSLRS
jgi:uncharacterized protein YlbG (UPF0298 family)